MARPGSTLTGVLAILLGTWTGVGGCMYATSALGGSSEVPDNPFLSTSQNQAVQDLVVATASYDPINAALSALSALVGPLLIIAGVVLISQTAQSGLVGRVAFGASIVADTLQAVWSVIWFALVWGPMGDYVASIARGMPNQPDGFADQLDEVTGIAIVLTALTGVLYFAVKVTLAGLGLWRSTRLDRVVDVSPPDLDPDLGWAD